MICYILWVFLIRFCTFVIYYILSLKMVFQSFFFRKKLYFCFYFKFIFTKFFFLGMVFILLFLNLSWLNVLIRSLNFQYTYLNMSANQFVLNKIYRKNSRNTNVFFEKLLYQMNLRFLTITIKISKHRLNWKKYHLV